MTRDTYDMFAPPDRGRFGDNETRDISANDRSESVTLNLVLHHQTPKALLVSTNEQTGETWLPKAAVTLELAGANATRRIHTTRGHRFVTDITVTLPKRLAREKGLLP